MTQTACAAAYATASPLPPIDLSSLRILGTAALRVGQSALMAGFLWLVLAAPGFTAPAPHAATRPAAHLAAAAPGATR